MSVPTHKKDSMLAISGRSKCPKCGCITNDFVELRPGMPKPKVKTVVALCTFLCMKAPEESNER